MFFLVYKHLKIRIIMFSLPQNDVGSGSLSIEIAMLHRHDSTVVQKGQTKHWISTGTLTFSHQSLQL